MREFKKLYRLKEQSIKYGEGLNIKRAKRSTSYDFFQALAFRHHWWRGRQPEEIVSFQLIVMP